MANHKSAKKRARQNDKRRVHNHSYMSSVRTVIKKYRVAIDELKAGTGDFTKAQELLSSAQSMLMKAQTKGLLHRNNAARRVGRLAHLLAKTPAK